MKQALKRHAHMVLDPLRTLPLFRAIAKTVKQGDVVVDVGTGIGLLAFAACHAGAKHVYAIDVDRASLDAAKLLSKNIGLHDRITWIEGLSFDVDLEKRADVIICETVGSLAFDENILASLADARKRFLKKKGVIIPSRIELWGALASLRPRRKVVTPSVLMTAPMKLASIHANKVTKDIVHITKRLRLLRNTEVTGIACWPRITWAFGCGTDASPLKPTTHWGQGFLATTKQNYCRGDEVELELHIAPDVHSPRLQTDIRWRLKPCRPRSNDKRSL